MNLSSPRTILALCLVFFAVGLAVQHAGLHAPMYYDSAGNIAEKRNVFAWEGLKGVMSLFPQRPLPTATLYLNFLVSDVDPVSYRLVNLAFLAVTSVLVVLLVGLLLELAGTSGPNARAMNAFVSILTGLIFLVHPLQTYLTLYIWQRMALMACFFSYACLLTYLTVRCGKWSHPALGYALCMMLFVAAVLSKENSIMVPPVLVLAELAFFSQSWTDAAKRACLYGVISLSLLGVISYLQHPHGDERLGTGILATMSQYYAESGLTYAQVLFTQSRVVFEYLFLIVFPVPSRAQLINPQVLSLSLTEPPLTAMAVTGVTGMIIAGVYLLKRMPLWGFGILFFLANLLPESLLVPQYAFFGYRPVLPMLGILLIGADCVARLMYTLADSPRGRLIRAGLVASLAGGIIFLITSTALRADLWSDPIRFWNDTVAAFPDDQERMEGKVAAHAIGNAGAALYAAGRYAEAADHYERAIALSPQDPRKMVSLAAVYSEMGNYVDAEALLQRAITLAPDFAAAYKNLGIVLMKQRKFDEALKILGRGLEHSVHDETLYEAIGQVHLMQRDVPGAIAAFEKAIHMNPRSAALHFQLSQALLARGDTAAAEESLKRAVALKPDYWEAYNSLGIVCAHAGRSEEALAHFRRALAINPGNPQLRANVDIAVKQTQGSAPPSKPAH